MMASTTNGPPPSNNPAGNLQSPVSNQKDGSVRPGKNNSAKMAERGRKESPADQARRPQQKAWTGGTNPLTQKTGSSAQPNGVSVQGKPVQSSKTSTSGEGGLFDKHNHNRLSFVLGGSIGLNVVFTSRSGERFEGIFAGSTLAGNSHKISMKMTKKIASSESQSNGVAGQEAALVGTSPEHAMTFDLRDMADLAIPQFKLPEASRQTNGAPTFQTDADIGAMAGKGAERALQPWVPDGPDTTDFSLESGSIGGWDQFAAHKQRFGDNSTYDENLYTTRINRTAPGYAEREANARRMANQINAEVSNIAHVREERGQAAEAENDDEEDKYSGVRREDKVYPSLAVGGPDKYTPPSRRAPTAQPTVPGAPVDSAIISAQLSKPDGAKSSASKATSPLPKDAGANLAAGNSAVKVLVDGKSPGDGLENSNGPASRQTPPSVPDTGNKPRPINTEIAHQHKPSPDNPVEDVENQVLSKFRQFADSERQRVADRKRAQQSQDRTAKLNDLMKFSKTFKLKTPIPTDLVGILAKDPAKQEAIVEKAQKQHEEAKTSPAIPASNAAAATKPSVPASAKTTTVPKFDVSQIPPPIPARDTFGRGRGGLPQHGVRSDRTAQQPFLSRVAPSFGQRPALQQDRKGQVPAPIPLPDARVPPTGPMADQTSSPHRPTMQTPTTAAASRFNVKATEFRPNINAPTFNPTGASNAPSSPSSVQRTSSISRTTSPSSFFGARKVKPAAERVHVVNYFNPVERMRKEIERRKAEKGAEENVKDYSANGGVPYAYHTAPTWTVKETNAEKKYTDPFHRPAPFSPQSRSSSAQHVPFHGQMHMGANGMQHVPVPQHGHPSAFGHHFDERMSMPGTSPQVYSSPGMASRQMSNFSSPMGHQAQLVYGQQQYFAGPGQMPMQVRQFPTTPNMMHVQPGQMAAPMMAQQQSSGPFVAYNQMHMYSPNAGHAYVQHNGYPSPGRMAPMMMHQNSQQSHHGGQPMTYGMSGQGGPMMYGNQPGQNMGMRPGYNGPSKEYGSSPHQPLHMQQRTMSSGYNQRTAPPNMAQSQGPPPNAPQQPAAFSQLEMPAEDSK